MGSILTCRRRKEKEETEEAGTRHSGSTPLSDSLYPPRVPGGLRSHCHQLVNTGSPARKINDHPLSNNDNPVPACLVVKNDEGFVCGGEGGEWGGDGMGVGGFLPAALPLCGVTL